MPDVFRSQAAHAAFPRLTQAPATDRPFATRNAAQLADLAATCPALVRVECAARGWHEAGARDLVGALRRAAR
jgi:hypothetical protein